MSAPLFPEVDDHHGLHPDPLFNTDAERAVLRARSLAHRLSLCARDGGFGPLEGLPSLTGETVAFRRLTLDEFEVVVRALEDLTA